MMASSLPAAASGGGAPPPVPQGDDHGQEPRQRMADEGGIWLGEEGEVSGRRGDGRGNVVVVLRAGDVARHGRQGHRQGGHDGLGGREGGRDWLAMLYYAVIVGNIVDVEHVGRGVLLHSFICYIDELLQPSCCFVVACGALDSKQKRRIHDSSSPVHC